MGIFSKPRLRSLDRREDMPEGLWNKCPDCGAMIHTLELKQNLHVCHHCGHHFLIDSRERIAMLADPDSFEETEIGPDFRQSARLQRLLGKNRHPARKDRSRRRGDFRPPHHRRPAGDDRGDGFQVLRRFDGIGGR